MLFAYGIYTCDSNREATCAIHVCRQHLQTDQVILSLIIQYLLVPAPRVFATLRRASGQLFVPRTRKGQGKGPGSLSLCPHGGLLASSSTGIFHWPTFNTKRTTSRRIAETSVCHAAVFVWKQCYRQHVTINDNDVCAATIDENGCLCVVDFDLSLHIINPLGVAREVGSLQGAITDSWPNRWTLDLAVVGREWFVADFFGHQIVRWREGFGADPMQLHGASTGCFNDLKPGQIAWPRGIAADTEGNLYISQDLGWKCGQVVQWSSRHGFRILVRHLLCPSAIAVGRADVFIAESGRRLVIQIRKSALPSLSQIA